MKSALQETDQEGGRKHPCNSTNLGNPFEGIAIDMVVPFPQTETGNETYLLEAQTISLNESKAINRFGAGSAKSTLQETDQGKGNTHTTVQCGNRRKNYESVVCQLMGIQKSRMTPLYPQLEETVERMNRTIKKHLSKVVAENQRD